MFIRIHLSNPLIHGYPQRKGFNDGLNVIYRSHDLKQKVLCDAKMYM